MTAPENIWAVCDEDVSAQTYDIYAQIGPEGFVDAPTQYIRADRYESLMKERDALKAKLGRAVKALAWFFYADDTSSQKDVARAALAELDKTE